MNGTCKSGPAIAPAGADGEEQQQHDKAAQGKRIAPSEAGPGPADAQPAELRAEASAMYFPEPGGDRVVATAAQLVIEGSQRAIRQVIDDFETPAGDERIGSPDSAAPVPEPEDKANGKAGQNG